MLDLRSPAARGTPENPISPRFRPSVTADSFNESAVTRDVRGPKPERRPPCSPPGPNRATFTMTRVRVVDTPAPVMTTHE